MDKFEKNESELIQEQNELDKENCMDKKAILLGIVLAIGIILIMLCQISVHLEIYNWSAIS